MRKQLGQMLIEAGVIDEKALNFALADQRRWGKPLGRTLVDLRLVREEEMIAVLGQQLGLPSVDLDTRTISQAVLDLVPLALVEQHNLVPFAVTGKFLDIAMTDPMNLGVIDELRIRTQLNIRPHLAGPQMIERALAKYYGKAVSSAPGFDKRLGPTRGRVTSAPDSIPLDAEAVELPIDTVGATIPGPAVRPTRDREIDALQDRISRLEALVERDESVLRKLLSLLIDKGIATREEIVERLG